MRHTLGARAALARRLAALFTVLNLPLGEKSPMVSVGGV
jgi:hypothetical protein